MLAFILRRVRASTLFLAPYEKLQRKFLKLALQVGELLPPKWGSDADFTSHGWLGWYP